jgi:hypothetical protein
MKQRRTRAAQQRELSALLRGQRRPSAQRFGDQSGVFPGLRTLN